MTEDELRRAYDALRHRRREAASEARDSSSPGAEAIWAAVSGHGEPGERVRILDDALRAGASDEVALAQSMHAAALDAATADAATRGRTYRFQRWGGLAAAAAALLIMTGVPLWQRTRTSTTELDGNATRYRDGNATSGFSLVTPVADAAVPADGRFVWRALRRARSYRLEAIDATGKTVATVTTTDTTAVLPNDITSADRERIAGWWVTATMEDGSLRRSDLAGIRSSRLP
jgi:hypothetical protein